MGPLYPTYIIFTYIPLLVRAMVACNLVHVPTRRTHPKISTCHCVATPCLLAPHCINYCSPTDFILFEPATELVTLVVFLALEVAGKDVVEVIFESTRVPEPLTINAVRGCVVTVVSSRSQCALFPFLCQSLGCVVARWFLDTAGRSSISSVVWLFKLSPFSRTPPRPTHAPRYMEKRQRELGLPSLPTSASRPKQVPAGEVTSTAQVVVPVSV